jgi:hypothetical protein
MNHALGLAAVLLQFLAASTAMAAGKPLSAAQRENARRHYEQGLRLYELNDQDAAIAELKQAYLITEAPELLFNIAQAHRRKGPEGCGPALELYRNFERAEPERARSLSVSALIDEMTRCLERRPAEAPTAPRLTPSSSVESAPSPPWGTLIVGGAGLGLTLLGGVVIGLVHRDVAALRESGCAPSCELTVLEGFQRRETLGYGLVVSGAALLAAAAVIHFWPTLRARHLALWTSFGSDGSGIHLGARF